MTTIEIPLTRGYVALIDQADAKLVAGPKWRTSVHAHTLYAVRETWGVNGPNTRTSQYMHALITGWAVTDHINGNGLDNRRENLREVTTAENQWNRVKTRGSSRYMGVHWHSRTSQWRAVIRVNNRIHHGGYHHTQEAAALAYDEMARRLRGPLARVNFPAPGEASALSRDGTP